MAMRRRAFIAALGSAAAWPLVARSQPPGQMRQVGVLLNRAADDSEGQAGIAAFREALQQLGWAEGRNGESTSAGARTMSTVSEDMRWNWSRSRQTSCWPQAL
jgi:hypothetical protein